MKRLNILKGDKVIWTVYIMLTLISLIAVYSSIGLSAIVDSGSTPTKQLLKHAMMIMISYAAIWGISKVDYRVFSRLATIGYLVSICLLLLAAVTKTRWISILGLEFQPSEIAKICLIVFVGNFLSKNKEHIDSIETFFKALFTIIVVVALIVFQNFSTAALVLITCYLMLYFAGTNKTWWWRFLLIGLVGVGLTLLFLSKSYQNLDPSTTVERAETWGHRIDTWLHPTDGLSQENMAKMAVARGKLTGVGIGNTIHARLMTQAHNDFIFSIIIEESGAIMGVLIFLLYGILYFRTIQIARKCKGMFACITISGIGTVIFIQAIMNMGVGVGLFPVTGQTLPFISYGGTAYVFLSCGIGIIQSVVNTNNKEAKKALAQSEPAANTQQS